LQALALGAALAFTSGAASAEDWVGTWTASVQPVWDADFPVPTNIPRSLWNQNDSPDGAGEHRRQARPASC